MVAQSSATNSSSLGPGLVQETLVPTQPDDGVVMQNETQVVIPPVKDLQAGDADFLKTLIFLAGALILIIWSVYLILMQKGIIKSKSTHMSNDQQNPVHGTEGNNK